MTVQLIRKVRDRQPTRSSTIDWINPITRKLVFAMNGAVLKRDLVDSAEYTKQANGLFPVPTKDGIGGQGALGTVDCDLFKITKAVGGEITVLAFYAHTLNRTANPWILNRYNTNTAATKHWLLAVSGNPPKPGFSCNNTTGTNFATNHQTTTPENEPFVHIGRVTSDGVVSVFLDGIKGTTEATITGTSNVAVSGGSSTEPFAVGNRYPNFGNISCGPVLLAAMWDRALSDDEIKQISLNPWQIFEPETIPLFYSTVTAQYARPTSDVSTGTWTASTGSDLFAMLDETTASDTDYIITTGASTCEVAITSLSDPASSTGHIVRYRISATSGGITVRLRQGTTTIATWTHATAPTSLTTYEQTLTSGEADSITDYSALKLQFEATA